MSDESSKYNYSDSERLLKDLNLYKQLSDASFEAIFLSDKGKCIGQNKAAQDMFGYTDEEAIGKYGTDWIQEDDRELVMKNMLEGNEKPYKATALRKNGTTFPCEIRGKMTSFNNKTIRITALKDISHDIKIEEQLRKINETKDIFFSILSHDLKSPFNAFLGYSDLILRRSKEKGYGKIEKYAYLLNITAKKSFSLLNNLLDWSKSQRGLLQTKPTRINIFRLLKKLSEEFNDQAQKKEISILINTKPDAEVISDVNMLNTIIRNLLLNALKFTENQGKIILSSKINNEFIIFSVRDNGIGIPEDKLESLFKIESYFSTPGTNNEKGNGLGLILCHEFVNKLKGSIWVESKINEGTTFYFSIPK